MNAINIKDIQMRNATDRMLNTGWKFFRGALLFSLCFVLLYPLLYMVTISFRAISDLYDVSVIWIPKNFTLDNIKDVVKAMNYLSTFFTTFKESFISSIFLTVSCALTGYGFARFNFKGKKILFSLVLFTIIVPPQTHVTPMYLQYRFFDFFGLGKLTELLGIGKISANLIGTMWTFYLPALLGSGIRAGLYIYIFRQFFRGLPKELEDAASIDGCSALKAFTKVMVPNSIPAFITVFLFSIVWYWNDYLLSGMFLADLKTLSISLILLEDLLYASSGVIPDVNQVLVRMQAGSLLLVAPLVILYVFLQRYFIESIERTGIVG